MKTMTRREFALLSTAALAGMAAGCKRRLRTRRNIQALSSADVDVFRAGITAMNALGMTDIRSATYQTYVHGAPWGWEEVPGIPADAATYWVQCEHGTPHFLTWHRWYLRYWEQIVRELCGSTAFDLPYWDSVSDRFLPAVVRAPADASNSLYNATREPDLNAGAAQLSGLSNACLSQLTFAAFSATPGLEQNFHNTVHNQIGGQFGNVEQSGRDPLFYLHHCNVDRYWECWLRMGDGRANPADAAWNSRSFQFQSLAGPQTPVVNQALRASNLGYRYDSCPVVLTLKPEKFKNLRLQKWPVLKVPVPDPPPFRTLIAFEPAVLDGNDNAVVLPRAELDRAKIDAAPGKLVLGQVATTELAQRGGFVLEIWLAPDAAALEKSDLDGAVQVGSFGAFDVSVARAHATRGHAAHAGDREAPTLEFAMPAEAMKLLGGRSDPALVFVRRGVVDPQERPVAFDADAALFRVGALSVKQVAR